MGVTPYLNGGAVMAAKTKAGLYRRPSVPMTEERARAFLVNYRNTGRFHLSCELTGMTSDTVKKYMKRDPDFAADVEEAKELWIDEFLVSAAVRRAVEGVDEPIIGGKERDQVVTHRRVYSDSLLNQLLKANRPEFREKGNEGSKDSGSGGVMIIPAGPTNVDDWQAKFGRLATGDPEDRGENL